MQPQTFAVPAPPHVCGAVQVPQLSVPVQPSEMVPQFFPWAAHVVGVQGMTPQTFGEPPPPQTSGAVQLPQAGAYAGKINGRDHNHWGFTVWMAGGGVKGGQVYGATDEFGFQAVENPVHVHDLHATILHLLGFDHERLTYRYAGRDFRLTDVHGNVVRELIA